jgi:3-oxoacyl-[acyl-carrier-protein] synthase II
MNHRAVITGIGILSPLGNTAAEFFSRAIRGSCGIKLIQKFDTTAFPVKIGGEIDCTGEASFSDQELKEMPAVSQWSVLAARKAVRDANLDLKSLDPYSIDVILGVSVSSLEKMHQQLFDCAGAGMAAASAEVAVFMNPAAAAIQIAKDLNLHGETTNITTACSSSTTAIGYAARQIQSGESKCVLTGGADEGVTQLFVGAFARMLSQNNAAPSEASRPFERRRDGIILSDAACIFVVEEYAHAVSRGAEIYCELTGFGNSRDDTSAMKLCQSEEYGARAIEMAMRRACRSPDQIDYYCALGVSERFMDVRETRMVKRVFRENAHRLPVSSIKSMMGHPQAATGAVQAAVCALAIRHNTIPPTINYQERDPECDLDYVPNQARSKTVRNTVLYTLGNGGNNSALVLSAC